MKTEIKVTLQMHLKKRSKFAFCLSMCGTGMGVLLGRKQGRVGGGEGGRMKEKLKKNSGDSGAA